MERPATPSTGSQMRKLPRLDTEIVDAVADGCFVRTADT
jgi:hypothetical protein